MDGSLTSPPRLALGLTDQRQEFAVDLARLMAGRCLIQGSSGAGKSWALRRLVEQAHGHLTTVIVDPEGEFENLAELIGATPIAAAETSTDGLTAMALAVRRHRLSVHLDLTDLSPDARIAKAAAFFSGLVMARREDWANTCLVAVDEAHLLAPHVAASSRDAEARRLGIAALTELCARGRKRGLGIVLATQRLAKVSASVLAELHNVLIGINMLDVDVKRAGELLGWPQDKAAMLRDLKPGQFVAMGSAFVTGGGGAGYPTPVTIHATVSRHLGGAPTLAAPAALPAGEARELLGVGLFSQHRDVDHGGAMRGGGARVLDAFLLDPAGPAAARIVAALAPIVPNATPCTALVDHLALAPDQVGAALDLLAALGVVDTVPRGNGRIARLSARLRLKVRETPVVGLA
ncbi:MAG: DUF87 domain-containing protein [Azospirillum sp.]|nr:DUF87 domain-containing protein [Azospirillum sp.]